MKQRTTFRNEKDVKHAVKALLTKHTWFWWMIPANGYGKSGTSDFHALRDGVFLAIETKFGTNKPTALQIGFLNSINAENAFGFVVSDRNLDEFKHWLELFDRSADAISRGAPVAGEDGATMLDCMRTLTELLA